MTNEGMAKDFIKALSVLTDKFLSNISEEEFRKDV